MRKHSLRKRGNLATREHDRLGCDCNSDIIDLRFPTISSSSAHCRSQDSNYMYSTSTTITCSDSVLLFVATRVLVKVRRLRTRAGPRQSRALYGRTLRICLRPCSVTKLLSTSLRTDYGSRHPEAGGPPIEKVKATVVHGR